MDEHRWIHAVQKGDKSCLQDIAEEYYDDIFRFCAFQTGSREEAYDLTQETFLRFIRYVEGYHDRNLKGYLLTIAMNVCRDFLRKKERESGIVFYEGAQTGKGFGESGQMQAAEDFRGIRRQEEDAREQSFPERRAIEADVHRRLLEALGQLPEVQREAILLHYLYELKYRETAQLTEVSVSTVKSRVRQGMDKLQNILKREDFFD